MNLKNMTYHELAQLSSQVNLEMFKRNWFVTLILVVLILGTLLLLVKSKQKNKKGEK